MIGVDPKRSAIMARVRGKNTKPELVVRRVVYALGHRYRLHRRDLPGSPDLVFRTKKRVIFVHGCFWHRHAGCRRTTFPKIRVPFWRSKFAQNIARDARNIETLSEAGWKVLVVWECETDNSIALRVKLRRFLGQPRRVAKR